MGRKSARKKDFKTLAMLAATLHVAFGSTPRPPLEVHWDAFFNLNPHLSIGRFSCHIEVLFGVVDQVVQLRVAFLGAPVRGVVVMPMVGDPHLVW